MGPADIERAAEALRAGGVIILPTDTVYGLAADALCAGAMERLFALKQRPLTKPAPVLLASPEHAERYAEIAAAARRLMDECWPGGLTVIVRARGDAGLAPGTTGQDGTVGLRVPADLAARAIIERAGSAVAGPSANRAGEPPPTALEDVDPALRTAADFVVDGGVCPTGEPSTVVSVVDEPIVLRLGAVPVERLTEILGRSITLADEAP